MECIAHRGFAGLNPENTVPAVRAAAADADWVEVDVRRCGSGEAVVVQEATVDRVTDASGRVDELTGAELAALDVLASSAGIPPLTAVLEAVDGRVGIDVELKGRGLVSEVTRLLADRDGPALVSSFEPDAVAAPSVASDVPTALIGETDPGRLVARASSLDCAVVCLCQECGRRAVVDRAHADELPVYAWTVRDRVVARGCAEMGVDGLIADVPGACAPP